MDLRGRCSLEASCQEQALAFLDDLTTPFDNTQVERDLRLLKTRQKVSSCFRSDSGAATFARLRSYISPLRKQRVALLDALHALFTGSPLFPPGADQPRALYGDVGSAPLVFRTLSRMMVQLAQQPMLAASVESLESFLHAEWRKRL
ncbi:MAG TPA: transposase [Ktedonobacterales bacterium]|nr:transposase [Ktedonobacterales bacterium]